MVAHRSGVVDETNPLFVGIYEGAMGKTEVTKFVEESDCVLLLGTFMTDINLGIYTAKLDVKKCIYATSEQLQVSYHHYPHVSLHRVLEKLIEAQPKRHERSIPPELHGKVPAALVMDKDRPLEIKRIMQRINAQLDTETIVIADVGDALFASSELVIRERTDYLAPAYYTSMGFAVPATLGACIASPESRVLTIVGDGAFQMTGQEISTLIRRGHNPIILVLDNHGYGTERFLQKGNWAYNEIARWNYSMLPAAYGGGKGHLVATEGEFEIAFMEAWNDPSQLHLIHAKLIENDASETLLRLAERMGEHV